MSRHEREEGSLLVPASARPELGASARTPRTPRDEPREPRGGPA
jgi:hypothetical protein